VKRHSETAKNTFENESNFYCLIETSGSNAEHDEEKLSGLLEHVLSTGLVVDGVLAQDQTQFQRLWHLRESAAEAAGKTGSVYKYDVSVPLPKMYSLAEKMRARLRETGLLEGDGQPEGRIRALAAYGHCGDSNLHINIVADGYSAETEAAIEPYIYELVAAENGSISAEHGLGVMKAPHIGYSKSPESIELMRRIKGMFDPKGLLNPYKYIV
jgi:FAD/FMN-containing dehydrogenase